MTAESCGRGGPVVGQLVPDRKLFPGGVRGGELRADPFDRGAVELVGARARSRRRLRIEIGADRATLALRGDPDAIRTDRLPKRARAGFRCSGPPKKTPAELSKAKPWTTTCPSPDPARKPKANEQTKGDLRL
jgi:hypothetical protein